MVAYRIDCDGETFTISHGAPRQYHYTWTSGPHDNYGFSVSVHGSQELTLDDHLVNIRNFLGQIDPSTGYVEE